MHLISGQTMNLTSEFELPIVVLEGRDFEIAFESSEDITNQTSRNKFSTPDGVDLYLSLEDTTWFYFAHFNPAEGTTRSENWQIQWWKGNIQDSKKAFGMRVRHASKKDQ
jgi:hypothetical protein